jgi:hypothetical protein
MKVKPVPSSLAVSRSCSTTSPRTPGVSPSHRRKGASGAGSTALGSATTMSIAFIDARHGALVCCCNSTPVEPE